MVGMMDGGRLMQPCDPLVFQISPPKELRQVYGLSKTPQVVLDYQVTDFDGNLAVNWDYAEDAFDPEILSRMFHANRNLLKRLLTENWNEVQ